MYFDLRFDVVKFFPSQMEFSGLKDSSLTYEDKMQYVTALKKKYGFPIEEKPAAAVTDEAKKK